jgi:ATP adenylyltransferase
METLWAPWRMKYVAHADDDVGGCILCDLPAASQDEQNLILFRGKYNFVMMNLFPYNSGHLMIVPYRHISRPSLLGTTERNEHFLVVSQAVEWLQVALKPDGFNMGINLGRVAGAGIDQHMHTHIVPRWAGDTNFMPVTGQTKVMPESLEETYLRIRRQVVGAAAITPRVDKNR